MVPAPAASPKRGPNAGKRVIENMGTARDPSVLAGPQGQPRRHGPKDSPRLRQQSEATLIHEIGHHVSQSPPGPAEEARADRYMVTHWRPDPRDAQGGTDININRSTYLERLGGPYTGQQFEQTASPEPRPPKQKRKK